MYCRTNPLHPKRNAKGLYPLHRIILENKLGRLLKDKEEAHHVDEDKTNNEPDNIELKTKSQHAKLHNQPVGKVEIICPCCQKAFMRKPYEINKRRNRNRSNSVFCSRRCGRINQVQNKSNLKLYTV